MRLEPAFAAALLSLGLAAAASAQTRPAPVPGAGPPIQTRPTLVPGRGLLATPEVSGVNPLATAPQSPDELTRRTAAQDQAEADATTARLAALDAGAEADEARMTQLRDWDLNLENARIRAIKPVLPYHGFHAVFPHFYF